MLSISSARGDGRENANSRYCHAAEVLTHTPHGLVLVRECLCLEPGFALADVQLQVASTVLVCPLTLDVESAEFITLGD